MSRWATAAVVFLLVPLFGVSTLATCLAAPTSAPQVQMACCHHGHDACPMHPAHAQSAVDCCRASGQRQQTFSAAEPQASHVLVATVAPVLPFARVPVMPAASVRVRHGEREAGPPAPPRSRSTVLLI
jgi:hypothetical protein